MVELIAAKGYPAVRIADLAKLAHVSPPTLYSLYADKEQLLVGAYEDIARRAGLAIADAHRRRTRPGRGCSARCGAFAAARRRPSPQAVSLLVLGAFGAGPQVRANGGSALDALEAYIHANRSPQTPLDGRRPDRARRSSAASAR